MNATLRLLPRPDRLPRHACEPPRPDAGRGLVDRWFERWAIAAERRWRAAGDPHRGRHY